MKTASRRDADFLLIHPHTDQNIDLPLLPPHFLNRQALPNHLLGSDWIHSVLGFNGDLDGFLAMSPLRIQLEPEYIRRTLRQSAGHIHRGWCLGPRGRRWGLRSSDAFDLEPPYFYENPYRTV